jgi:hypothetical protein
MKWCRGEWLGCELSGVGKRGHVAGKVHFIGVWEVQTQGKSRQTPIMRIINGIDGFLIEFKFSFLCFNPPLDSLL